MGTCSSKRAYFRANYKYGSYKPSVSCFSNILVGRTDQDSDAIRPNLIVVTRVTGTNSHLLSNQDLKSLHIPRLHSIG